MRRLLVVAVAIAAAGATVVTLDAPATAQEDLDLALREQTFAVERNGTATFVFDLTGQGAAAAATTTTTTTTTTTAPPPDTVPAGPPPAAGTAAPAPATTTSTTTTTTTTTTIPADDAPPGEGLKVWVTAFEPVEERSQVAAVLSGRLPDAVNSARYDLADVVAVDESTGRPMVTLEVQTATGGQSSDLLELPLAGLYPVTVEIRDGNRVIAEHITFLERLPLSPTTARPTGLAVVAGIPDPGPQLDPVEQIEARTRLIELAQLGEDLDAPLTVAVPPSVLESIADDAALLDRLRAALDGDEAISLPAVPLDPSAAVAVDLADRFTEALIAGEEIVSEHLPATPTRRSAWLARDPVTSQGAALLRTLGMQLLVVPYEDLIELDNNIAPGVIEAFGDPTRAIDGRIDADTTVAVMTVDPFEEVLDPERPVVESTPAADAVRLFAELRAIDIQLPTASRNLILSTVDLGIPDPDVLRHLERFDAEHPATEFRSLDRAASTTDVMRINGERFEVALPDVAAIDLSARTAAIRSARIRAASTASMLPADDPRPAQWDAELDVVVSTGIDEDEAMARITAILDELQRIRGAIDPPEPFKFTLTGADNIPIRVGNTGPTPLRIAVRVSSSKLSFPDDHVEAVVPAESFTDIEVPVEVLSNGTFPVAVELLTPAGEQLFDPIPLTARVNALSGLGPVLTVGALLVLASWWFSHLRRRRRERVRVATVGAMSNHPSHRWRVRSAERPEPAGGPPADEQE